MTKCRPEKESIHSGHFMVSHFEAEAQDDEDDLAVALPDESEASAKVAVFVQTTPGIVTLGTGRVKEEQAQQIAIETSLNKLFQCMTLAYRQKLTSPKWNRFKGIKLRWKDKIRLNNVIWRCWHMQFILKQNTQVCQFASPLDVDTHIKPEATILEGKYWKRRAEAITAEYKKWRMYYRTKSLGLGAKDVPEVVYDMDILDWQSPEDNSHMLVDEDYIAFMSDTLFSTITSNQPFAFPDSREIARGASLADFIQPSLGPLQPNLEDFMDTLEPLQELLSGSKLAPVPEENADDSVYKNTIPPSFMDQTLQQAIDQQTTQFQDSQSSHISQLPSHLSTDTTSHMLSIQGTLTNDLTLNQNACIDNQQSSMNTNILPRQTQVYLPQGTNQINTHSIPPNTMLQQQQNMMMQSQIYNVSPANIVTQQQNVAVGSLMPQQPSILTETSNQQQLQKQHNSYVQRNQKIYPQIPMTSFQDRNLNTRQGVQHSHNENNAYMNRVRTNSAGCIGYSTDRRHCPIVPAPAPNFAQFIGVPAQPLMDKPLYNKQCFDRGLSSSRQNQQNITHKGQPFVGSHMDPSVAANLSLGNNPRFKMPSPPPQVVSNSQLRIQQNTQHHRQEKKQIRQENMRSNSLPLGATLATVMGITSGGGAGFSTAASSGRSEGRGSSRGRRPRSGSSSPAPPHQRGPAPLVATASEPLLKDSSILLAHLLTAESKQPFFKPNSVRSIPDIQEASSQPHPIAIIQSPLVNQVPTCITSSSKIISFSANSPTSLPSPQSPLSPVSEGKGSNSSGGEHRRAGHIHAEHKRRHNIKSAFDALQTLIPQLAQNPNSKVSKAAMLQKGADYIKQLQAERAIMKEDIDNLKQQIEFLNNALSNCQSLLPATGAVVSRQPSGRLKEMFDDYVKERTRENWKFWIFSLLVEPLFHSFNSSVSPVSVDELKRSTYLWAEQHCSLVEMRPAALNSLRTLSTTTDILSNPEKLPEEVMAAVGRGRRDSLTNLKK